MGRRMGRVGWEQEQHHAQGPARGADLAPAHGNTGPGKCQWIHWLPQHLLCAHPDLHNHFHQKFPKKPRKKPAGQPNATSYCADPPAARRQNKAAAPRSTPAPGAGGTKNSRLVWEQPCNPHRAKGANPVPPAHPSFV